MKQTRVTNRIDQLIVRLESEFSKVPNFSLLMTDEKGNKLFNFFISKISEIQDYKVLYHRYFIPSANKAISDTHNEIVKSTFRKFIRISTDDLKENLFETIRLSYVGLFHKIENYNKGMIKEAEDFLYDEEYPEKRINIEKFAEIRYGYKFFQWQTDPTIFKINWICNCVKHYNSFPLKVPKPSQVDLLPSDQKLKISKEELIVDIDYVMNNYYLKMLQNTLLLGLAAKYLSEFDESSKDPNSESGEEFTTKIQDIDRQLKILLSI